MANYTKATDFASKDTLPSGDANKVIRGSEINEELANIQTAVNSKADLYSPTLTGTPLAPTATAGTNTTQIATTAFSKAAIDAATTSITSAYTSAISAAVTAAVDNISTLNTWTIEEAGGVLYFKVGGVGKAKLDASGNLTVVGNVTAYGTI